jgi:hypothetical protein
LIVRHKIPRRLLIYGGLEAFPQVLCLENLQDANSVPSMSALKTLHIFLEQGLKDSAEAGHHNLMTRIENAMSSVDHTVEYHLDTTENRAGSQELEGYSLFHMQPPTHARSLNLRRAYLYPFWRIEPTAQRWQFRVAKMKFPRQKQEPNMAKNFANGLRKRHFDGLKTSCGGYIYMPLQGRLTEHRSFQNCSPFEMIEQTLATDPNRVIQARLHPNETYTAEDLARLQKLQDTNARFCLSQQLSDTLLANCDYVVCQNSAVALMGYILHKPAVLFAQIDFHHIAGNVGTMGLEAAFAFAQERQRPFDQYMLWFLRKMAINGGNENAERRILEAMRKGGWQM